MDMDQYVARFDASLFKDVSLDNLAQLQNLHLLHVPFENLDVIRRTPIYLNLKTIYDKVVTNHRGGYCYELNGLFQTLLTSLGYEAHLISATVLGKNGKWAKADTHAAIIVQLDKPYLVDVGFGAATPRLPIPLDGSERVDLDAVYSVKNFEGPLFDLMRKSESGERTLYRFNVEKKYLLDFHEGCVFNQISKDSVFTHTDIVTRATPVGRITLSDHTLTEIENGVPKTSILSAEDKSSVLLDLFQLRV